MKYYPERTLILENAQIIRDRYLPSGMRGEVLFNVGDSVTPTEDVVWGTRPSDYKIIDVSGALNLASDDERLQQIITVKEGHTLKAGTPLGESNNRGFKRKIPTAPANSIVSLVEQGRVILQVNPETVRVQARLTGEVIGVEPSYGLTIESQGTLLQCAWGNGAFSAAGYAFEPGTPGIARDTDLSSLADLLNLDLTLSPYRGKAIILMRPLVEFDLHVIDVQELAGIVAPSATPDLREKAKRLKVPVILTEGFGRLPPTARLYDLLKAKQGAQAIFDATPPDYRNNVRPEIIIPGGSKNSAIPPDTSSALAREMLVRIRRAPYAGRIGKITNLPEMPNTVENGLRVLCAEVKLQGGDLVMVPLANLESLGDTGGPSV